MFRIGGVRLSKRDSLRFFRFNVKLASSRVIKRNFNTSASSLGTSKTSRQQAMRAYKVYTVHLEPSVNHDYLAVGMRPATATGSLH